MIRLVLSVSGIDFSFELRFLAFSVKSRWGWGRKGHVNSGEGGFIWLENGGGWCGGLILDWG